MIIFNRLKGRLNLPASILAQQLNLKKTRNSWEGGCPGCGYPTGFSLAEKNGKLLWHCHAGGCSQLELLETLKRFLADQSMVVNQPVNIPLKEDWQSLIQKLWTEAITIKGTLAEQYLNSRRITVIPDKLGFHPEIRHTATNQTLPCMLALIQHDTDVFGLHRTFLITEAGGVKRLCKTTLGLVSGGSIRLAEPEPGKPLIIAEGIENTLSGMQLTGYPGWCASNAGNLATMRLPETVRQIYLCVDADKPGEAAAEKAILRWRTEGRRVQVFKPNTPGQDINDLLREAIA